MFDIKKSFIYIILCLCFVLGYIKSSSEHIVDYSKEQLNLLMEDCANYEHPVNLPSIPDTNNRTSCSQLQLLTYRRVDYYHSFPESFRRFTGDETRVKDMSTRIGRSKRAQINQFNNNHGDYYDYDESLDIDTFGFDTFSFRDSLRYRLELENEQGLPQFSPTLTNSPELSPVRSIRSKQIPLSQQSSRISRSSSTLISSHVSPLINSRAQVSRKSRLIPAKRGRNILYTNNNEHKDMEIEEQKEIDSLSLNNIGIGIDEDNGKNKQDQQKQSNDSNSDTSDSDDNLSLNTIRKKRKKNQKKNQIPDHDDNDTDEDENEKDLETVAETGIDAEIRSGSGVETGPRIRTEG